MQYTSIKGVQNQYALVGKAIHMELCNRLKFDHATKWYVRIPESVQEHGMHTIIYDFEIKTDDQISVRSLVLVWN